MNAEVVVSLENATIRSNNAVVLEHLNLTIKKGEHWVIIGPAGSGKTTLLNTIAGKTILAKGKLTHPEIDELLKTENTTWNKQHYIAQVAARHQFANLSNTTNFYYQQRFNASDADDAATVWQYLEKIKTSANSGFWTIDLVINRLKLNSLKDKHLIKLSNGETKRLLIATALLKNPLILTLDHPLTGLDVASRQDFNLLITEIAASGINVVMATSPHELPDAITNIAVLGTKSIAEQLNRKDYYPETTPVDIPLEIDRELLKKLTSAELKNYEKFVDMRNVVVKYGDKTILSNISWEVKQGERWALQGPNGSGKSTLLSLINADNPQAYANEIVLFDQKRGSGESIWQIKKNIGFVSPELFQYFPADQSCLQVIESGIFDTLGLFRPSTPKFAELAVEWMQLLGIDQHKNTLFRNVSASTQRLCLLARALIKHPALLIFDEPVQGLDARQQQHFKAITDQICAQSNATLIYVTHYEAELPDCITHTIHLKDGQIIDAL